MCSNAGFLFFGTVLRAIAAADAVPYSAQASKDTSSVQHSLLQPVKGLILDSAPCRLTPDISARYIFCCIHYTKIFLLSSSNLACSSLFDFTYVAVRSTVDSKQCAISAVTASALVQPGTACADLIVCN